MAVKEQHHLQYNFQILTGKKMLEKRPNNALVKFVKFVKFVKLYRQGRLLSLTDSLKY